LTSFIYAAPRLVGKDEGMWQAALCRSFGVALPHRTERSWAGLKYFRQCKRLTRCSNQQLTPDSSYYDMHVPQFASLICSRPARAAQRARRHERVALGLERAASSAARVSAKRRQGSV